MKPIPFFDGFAADAAGNIIRLSRRVRWRPGLMAAATTPHGYVWCNARASADAPHIGLRKGQRRHAHYLVCMAFHGEPPSASHEPHHINGVRDDNRPENLTWVTRSENIAHALEAGTMKRGSEFPTARLTEDAVRFIRGSQAKRAHSQAALAGMFGVSPSTIQSVVDRRAWKHVA
jgi:hypothetical protein